MMQKRNLYSLLLISFIVVFASSMAFANSVTLESKTLPRCFNSAANVSATVTADSVSAIEIVVEIDGNITLPAPGGIFTFDAGFVKLTDRVVDDTSGVDGVMPDTIRIAAMLLNPSAGALAQGTYVVGRINFKTNDVCSGSATMAGGTFTYPIPATVTTQFVDAATETILPATVTGGTITIQNSAPTLAAIPNATLFWGQTYTGTASGADADQAFGCENLTYSKVSGPAALTVNSSTGAISWTTTGADIGLATVIVKVQDKCGANAQQTFTICVQNKPPVITCPAPITVILGDPVNGSVSATDPDLGPKSLIYNTLSFDGPGSMVLNPATGAFSWATVPNNPAYVGTFHLTVVVTDSAAVSACSPSNADTCTVTINVEYSKVQIAKIHNQIQGQYADVAVYLNTSHPIGGFNLLIDYDASAMSLFQVIKGDFLNDCGWEYFTYRFGADGNCGVGCPTGLVRVVAIAETNNGANHPLCFSNFGNPSVDSTLFILKFLVSNDRRLECQYAPIKFFWIECGDNAFSSVTGDTLILSHRVYHYSYGNSNLYEVTNKLSGFPTETGAQASCDVSGGPGKPMPLRLIDFVSGGIDIVCADSIDARGDVNLNGLGYEIADAVLFSRYFIYGTSVFTVNVAGQTAATDANADGLVLTVADLTYLIKVVVGDAQPYAKPEVTTANGIYTYENGRLSVDNGLELGAAYVVVKGDVTPELLAKNMNIMYNFDGVNTRILVLPNLNTDKVVMTSFTGDFLAFNGEIVSVEMATAMGMPVATKLVPKHFALKQNYPNPFNPTTTIEFALPTASSYTLSVYNINGQVVKTFEGTSEAGFVKVNWNASEVASGVYFYKLNAGTFSATKKMVLLK